MYANLLKDKFPADERLGFYKFPKLPAKKLGKILASETRISSPNDVIGLYLYEGFFSTDYVIFTSTHCFYIGGNFLLEDYRDLQIAGNKCTAVVNQKGSFTQHSFSVGSEEAANLLRKVFQNIQSYDPKAATETPASQLDYRKFEGKALDWLLLRDEVMRTIDLLYDKFNEGKLSLLEYEEKKQELLDRL